MTTKKTTSSKDIGKKPKTKLVKRKVKAAPDMRGKTESQKKNYFQPGNKQGGRPLGSRNKFAEKFLSDFLADWQAHGAAAVATVRKKDPSTYIRVGASLVPKELNVSAHDKTLETLLEQYSISELDGFIAGLEKLGAGAARRDSLQDGGHQDQAQAGNIPDSLH